MDLYPDERYPQPSEGKNLPAKSEVQRLDPYSVDRQDSLMLCQQLQEKDGVDFMDQNMDLTPYLNDLQDIDGDMGEELIDKQRLIESDICTQQYAYPPHYTDLTSYEPKDSEQLFDDIMTTAPATPPVLSGRRLQVKTEAPWEDEPTTAEQSPQPTTSSHSSKEQLELTYTPTIKPRKYSLKPEAEKKNPLYRLKREKNNDAVRKSRSKAKEQQRMKDNQIKELQEKVGVMNQLLESKESRIKVLESAIREKQDQNAALLAENKRLRSELVSKKRC